MLSSRDSQWYIDAFKHDLLALMRKYDVSLSGVTQYDGLDEYCGTDFYFECGSAELSMYTIQKESARCDNAE